MLLEILERKIKAWTPEAPKLGSSTCHQHTSEREGLSGTERQRRLSWEERIKRSRAPKSTLKVLS